MKRDSGALMIELVIALSVIAVGVLAFVSSFSALSRRTTSPRGITCCRFA